MTARASTPPSPDRPRPVGALLAAASLLAVAVGATACASEFCDIVECVAASGGGGGAGGTSSTSTSGEGGGIAAECIPVTLQPGQSVPDHCGVFVQAGSSGTGTKTDPLGSVVSAANPLLANKGAIYVCGAETFTGSVSVAAGTSLFGGLTCGAWTYDPSQRPRISGVANTPAVLVSGVGATQVHDLDLLSAPGQGQGASSIGLLIVDADVVVARSAIEAGTGVAGASGAPQSPLGTVGGAAMNNPACNGIGSAGVDACNAINHGGLGGVAGALGLTAPNGGGAGGTSGPCDPDGQGKAGPEGSTGSAAAAAPRFGLLVASGFQPSVPGSSGAGLHGKGGGGGRGGVACAGSSGGAGGCGGAGGKPGSSGGASFAAAVLGGTLTLFDVALTSAAGGAGGAGAPGQEGGQGGPAGSTFTGSDGCAGGGGGRGGFGGPGAGGNGGPSALVATDFGGVVVARSGAVMGSAGPCGAPGDGATNPDTNGTVGSTGLSCVSPCAILDLAGTACATF